MTDGGEQQVPVLHVGGDVGGDADGERLACAASVMRVSATMYSFHAAMKAKITAVTMAGQGERQHHPQQRPQPPAAVHRRGLLDLARDRGEEGAQDPDGEGQVEGGVGQDERGVRVDQARARRTRGRGRPPARSARTSGSPAPGTGTPAARGTGAARCSRRRAPPPASTISGGGHRHHQRDHQPALEAGIAEHVEEVAGLPAHRQ